MKYGKRSKRESIRNLKNELIVMKMEILYDRGMIDSDGCDELLARRQND